MENEIPTFKEWLKKYFTEPKRIIVYYSLISGERFTETELKRKYKKAYFPNKAVDINTLNK